MELKEAYIEEIICHHFSVDPSKCLMNSSTMDLAMLDTGILKDFFIKPFAGIKIEYSFSHPVDLTFNVVYQTVLKIAQNDDFVTCSQDMYRHLQSVSTLPSIKDGDVFVAKICDILIGDAYVDGLGIFKIESKNKFIETFLDENGNMQFSIKNGFSSNKIDKACLIVFEGEMPRCLVIDTGIDTKFWRQDFLGLAPQLNSYSQSKAAMQVFQSFVRDELSTANNMTKDEQVGLLNQWTEQVKSADTFRIDEAAETVLNDKDTVGLFTEYRKAFEEREEMIFSDSFEVDKTAITLPKKVRTIKLDDTVEINLKKTGDFIERGFDENRGMNYYKLYFSKEK